MHRLRALLLATSLLVAGPALAEGSPDEGIMSSLADQLITRSPSVGGPGSVRPTTIHPVRGLHATAFPMRSFGLWGQRHGFMLTRRSAVYELQGGASWRIDDGVHLTASYRMVGVDIGFESDQEGGDGEPGVSAPFLGLAFDF